MYLKMIDEWILFLNSKKIRQDLQDYLDILNPVYPVNPVKYNYKKWIHS